MSVVRVASCRPNPWNRRRPVDPDLRDSIKECGLLQPIVVRIRFRPSQANRRRMP